MGTYEIPRNVKGEGRILFIFTTKSLIYTGISGAVGLLFFFILKTIGLTIAGIVVALIFAALGWAVATLKVPEIPSLRFTTQTAGQNIDDVLKRAIKFKSKKRKIYVYTKEEDDGNN